MHAAVHPERRCIQTPPLISLPLRINWYNLYGAAVNVVWLTALIILHAAVLTAATAALCATEQASTQCDICFVHGNESGPDAAVVACEKGDNVPDDAPFSLHLDNAARRIFRVPRRRAHQLKRNYYSKVRALNCCRKRVNWYVWRLGATCYREAI